MRILHYPKLVSVQSFQRPNFELVADLLCFMVRRYDTEIQIHDSIDTENDRIHFITGIVKAIYHRAGIKLNAKKLYAADGYAVKELLKIALILKNAKNVATIDEEISRSKRSGTPSMNQNYPIDTLKIMERDDISKLIDLDDIKKLRKLASELTEKGSAVFELLCQQQERDQHKNEEALKFLDTASTGFDECVEVQFVENKLLEISEKKTKKVAEIEQLCKVMESDSNDLVEDIKKKTMDLERNKKRLESIQNVRPAFMSEYEQLEIELQKHYELYMERYRNVHYLKKEMENFQKEEEDRAKEIERAKKKLQSQIQEEEMKILRDEFFDDQVDNDNQSRHRDVKNNEINNAVPSLDTTDDSIIIIEGSDDGDNVHENNVKLEPVDTSSVDHDLSSFGISTGTRDTSKDAYQSLLSSKSVSMSSSVVSGMTSNTGNEDDESDIVICNKSSDSTEMF